jgi:hypothetical protein
MTDREKLTEAMVRAIGEKYGYRTVEGGYYIFVGALQPPMPVDDIAEVALTAIEAAWVRDHGVTHAAVRDGEDEWHIECRFADGTKFAAVHVDYDREALAHFIADALNAAPAPTSPEEGA